MKCPVCGSDQGYMVGVLMQKMGKTNKQVWDCNSCDVVSILKVPQISPRDLGDAKK